jgi:hypothetical protein
MVVAGRTPTEEAVPAGEAVEAADEGSEGTGADEPAAFTRSS